MFKKLIYGSFVSAIAAAFFFAACGGEENIIYGPIFITAGEGIGLAAFPSWGPGNIILFSDSGNGDLWTCAADGTNKKRITKTTDLEEGAGDWAPDGEFIVYDAKNRETGERAIYVLKLDGGEPVKLQDSAWGPKWAPNGAYIAFNYYGNGGNDVWVIPAGGGAARAITDDGASYLGDWAPNAGAISVWKMSPPRITIRGFPNGEEKFDFEPPYYNRSAEFSPNGEWLAFKSGYDIWLVNVKSRVQKRVTAEYEGVGPVPDSWGADFPTWAPDGSAVAFFSWRAPTGIFKIATKSEY